MIDSLLQEGGHLPGPESGLLSTTQKCIVCQRHACWQNKRLYYQGYPGRKNQGKGTQKGSATCLTVSGFMAIRLVSRLSLPNNSDSGSFLSHNGVQQEVFWEVGRTCDLVSAVSFWLFLNYSRCSWLFSSVFLTRTFCYKITHANGCCGAW